MGRYTMFINWITEQCEYDQQNKWTNERKINSDAENTLVVSRWVGVRTVGENGGED